MNSSTSFPASVAPLMNSSVIEEVFPFLGLPFKIIIYLPMTIFPN
ncbi:MAG: hypothetical protein UHW99_05960 [Methanobrevibacter sp.]|nr:hypothetical protein [Methanobrevibacter sp.]